MPINGMSVGRDYSFGLYDGDSGTIVDFGDVQSVKITAQYHDIKSQPYNGDPRFGHIPDGYKGSFSITRTKGDLDDLQAAKEAMFRGGQIMAPGYLNETITNTDGTISRYQYTGVDFKIVELADVSREKVVTQTVEIMASGRVKIS